jgi:hypothetical protein
MTPEEKALRAQIAAEIVGKFGGTGPYKLAADFVRKGGAK